MTRKAIIVVLTLGAVGTVIPTSLNCLGVPMGWESSTGSPFWFISSGEFFLETHEVLDTRLPESTNEWSFTTPNKADWLFGNHEFYLGEAIFDWEDGTSMRRFTLHFSLFTIFVLFAAYPTIAFIRGPLRHRYRRRKGLCVKCGYNLTGNTSGTCSECGRTLSHDSQSGYCGAYVSCYSIVRSLGFYAIDRRGCVRMGLVLACKPIGQYSSH